MDGLADFLMAWLALLFFIVWFSAVAMGSIVVWQGSWPVVLRLVSIVALLAGPLGWAVVALVDQLTRGTLTDNQRLVWGATVLFTVGFGAVVYFPWAYLHSHQPSTEHVEATSFGPAQHSDPTPI